MSKKANALIHSSSPYLLQHAYNPVEWNEWNPAILERSKAENKLMIISIGYAACHWCHVMEHESFENEEVAEWMNGFFINIKVDREERPDVDAVYMNVAQITTGRGGWPLNVICLPGGDPVYAGTYFQKDNWIKVLQHFISAWKKDPGELKEVASQIKEGLYAMEDEHFKTLGKTEQLNDSLASQMCTTIIQQVDMKKGGLDKAPKFPMPCIFDFLLNYHAFSGDALAKQALHATLINMMEGGIYDQAGGGFARYSVDEYWFVPHFEKMLYDNGQLLSLYAKAFAQSSGNEYLRIVNETIEWIHREMADPTGLFYASLDADSEGVEGKFYCFSKAEIETIVPERSDIFCDYYSIREEGNWEHMNILYVSKTVPEISEQYQVPVDEVRTILANGKKALLKARENRIRPGLDDKCITSWNALTITGLLRSYQLCDHAGALDMAKRSLDFLRLNCRQENGLYYRNYKNGKPGIEGFLDDQALMIEALIEMYRTTWDETCLLEAKDLALKTIGHYYDEPSQSFYYSGKEQQKLAVRTREITDNVIPASNSIMANNLYQLGHYFENDEWLKMSINMCKNVAEQSVKFAPYFANWGNCILSHTHAGYEIAIIGNGDVKELYKIPGAILMKKTTENSMIPLLADKPITEQQRFYVCKNKACGLPETSVNAVIASIAGYAGK